MHRPLDRLTSGPRAFAAARGRGRATGERGFTLIEILIALLIGLFLLGALLTIVQSNKRVFGDQNQMSQLQDSERIALSLITDVVQSTGYFPDPTGNSGATTFPAVGSFAALQTITGTYSAAAPGDTLSVRYGTYSGDGVINCSGGSNTTGNITPPPLVFVNTFQVVNGQLQCTLTTGNVVTGTYQLVSGLTNMSVLYGVNTTGVNGSTADTYMNATQVTAANDWGNVVSVLVALTFTNPLYNAANPQGQQPTVVIQRVIDVMNQTGPTL